MDVDVEHFEDIPDAKLIRPDVHSDGRGFFIEIVRDEMFGMHFRQSNHSHSRAGVLRGLHYHHKQSDAWYVASGKAQVALADLREKRRNPPVVTLELSSDDPALLYIPPGVAHGFLAMSDLDLIYWVTHYYDPADEFTVAWNDPALRVRWAATEPILSPRDADAPSFEWENVGRA
jgi:dTDP-4-dehydrorhamnose 3,5-epimerase